MSVSQALRDRTPMSDIFPVRGKEELVTTSLRLPKAMLKDLDETAEEQDLSRTEVMVHLLRWALEQYKSEKKGKR